MKDIFSESFLSAMSGKDWVISEEEYDPSQNLKNESLFALSNGYMGIRGCQEEGACPTLPYFYVSGVFDKSETFMRELAALPNWLGLKLYVEKQLLGVDDCTIVEYYRGLDMKRAALIKHVVLEDRTGRRIRIEGIRFVSRNNVHRAAIRLWITPLNFSGTIEIEQISDSTVINFFDAPRFKVKHTLMVTNCELDEGANSDGTYVEVATRDNDLHVGVGSRITGISNGKKVLGNRAFHAFGEQSVEFADFQAEQNQTTEITKYVSIYTERDCARDEIMPRIQKDLHDFLEMGFEKEFTEHCKIYTQMWDMADIRIHGDAELDRAVRFNIFHLMSAGNEHDDRVNVGGKLLSGEEYGGHAFWDTELFILPFFAHLFPRTAANLETYRYRLLGAAEENARRNGHKGAQYPWESADDGTEQSPAETIEPDGTSYPCYVSIYEQHVTAAVAYGIYNYVRITGDRDFLYSKGIEILTQTARFWANRCEYIPDHDHYEINQVTGPDEWHEPVNNNTYTNYLAQWNLRYVVSLLHGMSEHLSQRYSQLVKKTGISDTELEVWNQIQRKIYLPRKHNSKLLEQFEGYFDLLDVVIDEYDENDWPVRPAALKTHEPSETQIIKQADVVMLLFLLGGEFDAETLATNYEYYERRTMHGSSLSPSIYSIVGLRVGDSSKAYRYLRRAAFLDLLNLQGNTREGIHAANTGGVWQTIIFGFAGVSVNEKGILSVSPKLPSKWDELDFKLHYQGSLVRFQILGNNTVNLTIIDGPELMAEVNGEIIQVGVQS